ncbi:MAG TPA: hypothetical protein VJ608_06740 [Albitalea sp.]|nr:hypothetical protein [Albitalea sp.]
MISRIASTVALSAEDASRDWRRWHDQGIPNGNTKSRKAGMRNLSTQLKFLSVYRGESHYRVIGGPMHDARVVVRHNDAAWYAATGDAGAELSGMVTSYGRAVTPDVMHAAQELHTKLSYDSTATLWNGRWDGAKYVREGPVAVAVPPLAEVAASA